MMLVAGPVARPIPPRRLPPALTGPNDQRREPADQRKPNHQHKNHQQILLSASHENQLCHSPRKAKGYSNR
jgi:hypothetical protein